MNKTKPLILSLALSAFALPAFAQFTGPSVQGNQSTVEAATSARVGTYVTLQGNIVSHLREDYFLFRDDTGEMRIEIPAGTFGGQQVGPDDTVVIMGEIDRSLVGPYVWVKSLSLSE